VHFSLDKGRRLNGSTSRKGLEVCGDNRDNDDNSSFFIPFIFSGVRLFQFRSSECFAGISRGFFLVFPEYAEVWNGKEGIETRNLIFLLTDVAHVPPCSFVYIQWNFFCQPE
jgi:hypothetical protein